MFLSGFCYLVYFRIMNRKPGKIFSGEENLAYILIIIITSLLFTEVLHLKEGTGFWTSFQTGFFQSASFITSSGYYTTNYLSWPMHILPVVYLLLFVGGSTGSASGGIKIARFLILLKNLKLQFKIPDFPGEKQSITYNHKPIGEGSNLSILTFITVFGLLFVLGAGFAFYRLFYRAEEPHYNHSLIVAAAGWLGITLMGGLPFLMIAHITPATVMNQFIPEGADYTIPSLLYFRNPLHCFFESMSAYTTTGLSMAVHEPSVGKGVLFYRSLAQWVGGAGFIVMVLAVFKQISGKSAILLYGSEATGERLKPKVIETARAIWKVYLVTTLFSTLYLIVGTWLILPEYPISDNIFDSINHAMAGQSTGGFSTLDNHMADYHSPAMDFLYLLPMILGSFSIIFYYKVIYERKYSEIWKDIQTRALLIAFLFGSIIQAALLFCSNSVPDPVREGIFQFVSAMSTTGWQTSNIGNWDWISVTYIVATAMFVGGASGATVGGIKMIRALIIQKGLRWQVNKTFLSSNTVKLIKFNGKTLLPEEMNEEFTKAASFAIIFFLLILGSSVITTFFMGNNFSYADALFESASAQATAGLSSGITDPSMSPVLELLYIFQMWTGRLEVIPVLALIRAIFFGTSPRII